MVNELKNATMLSCAAIFSVVDSGCIKQAIMCIPYVFATPVLVKFHFCLTFVSASVLCHVEEVSFFIPV